MDLIVIRLTEASPQLSTPGSERTTLWFCVKAPYTQPLTPAQNVRACLRRCARGSCLQLRWKQFTAFGEPFLMAPFPITSIQLHVLSNRKAHFSRTINKILIPQQTVPVKSVGWNSDDFELCRQLILKARNILSLNLIRMYYLYMYSPACLPLFNIIDRIGITNFYCMLGALRSNVESTQPHLHRGAIMCLPLYTNILSSDVVMPIFITISGHRMESLTTYSPLQRVLVWG